MILAAHASEKFNQWLGEAVRSIARETGQALGGNLHALALGGGYGRGEGGVQLINGEERPYNDLDFCLAVKDKRKVDQAVLQKISERWAPRLGLHVDFSRPLSCRDLERLPPWLVWKELIEGHIPLAGEKDAFSGRGLTWLPRPLPRVEAAKLLLNRGAGLLWAMRVDRGAEAEPDQGFVVRNYQKCTLSLGEALLIVFRRHQTLYQGRDKLLEKLAGQEAEVKRLDLTKEFAAALRAKLRPDQAEPLHDQAVQLRNLAEKWGQVLLLVEAKRTSRNFASMNDYTAWCGLREPMEHKFGCLPRNLYRQFQLGKISWRYPRESMYRSLPVLLGLAASRGDVWEEATAGFLALWENFN